MAILSNFFSSLSNSLSFQTSDKIFNSTDNDFERTSSSMTETNLPITGICLITKLTSVPRGYDCIRKTYDDPSRDADLQADSLLERKDRFLCITHYHSSTNNNSLILEDIKIINERDTPTQPYQAMTHTQDTSEKGTSKRTICVKFVARQVGMKCVCDIIFLCRSKRPPQFYTIIGEINGLQMCVKEGTVPILRPPPSVSTNLYPTVQMTREPTTPDISFVNPLQKKSDEKEILDGIPFAINPKYLVANRHNNTSKVDSFRTLSSYELEQAFHYDFHLEQAAK